jgi:hypothetical protein
MPWVPALILITAVAISILATTQLALLNVLYLPVLLVAYLGGRGKATLTAVICVVLIAFLFLAVPEQFASGEREGRLVLPWFTLFVWGGLLIVAAQASGTVMDQFRQRQRAERSPASPPELVLYNIGTLAIIKGYLRHDQVLKILQIQQKNQKLFGEIATGLRVLSPAQVEELLRIQKEKRSVTSSEIAMAKLELAKARKDRAV